MKRIIYKYVLLFQLVVMITAVSCSKQGFLDPVVTADLNLEKTFVDSAKTMEFLNNVYNGVSYLAGPREVNTVGAPLSECTDEADSRWPGAHNVPIQIISGNFTGNWMNRNTNDWSYLFSRVRAANIYLAEVDKSPLSSALKSRTKLEVRFLRAYFYHLLTRNWGGVPLVRDTVYTLTSGNNMARATYEECVNYMVKELDEIAPQLPNSYTGIDYGRITKGACLALKARVLLYAASPLFNGGSFATDNDVKAQTAYPTEDLSRWQKALDAAQAVVSLNQYQLEEDNSVRPGGGFYNVFLKRINSEYILAWMRPLNRDIESNYLTPTRGGSFLHYPSQNLVDAFPMRNGMAPLNADGTVNTASGYDPNNPYVNRDPRFYYTVIYNGSLYYLQSAAAPSPVLTYTGTGATTDAIVAISGNGATNNGYYRRKMADSLIAGNSSTNTERCLPLIRYAEVLLNLAEAANETGNTSLAMQQLKAIRKRAGILPGTGNNYGLPASPTKDEARELIRNERFIELAFEEHRYYDLRRWKLGSLYDGKFNQGMRIARVGTTGNNYTYTRINVRSRYFKTSSYLFPIPQVEIALNPKIKQNPGW